MTLNGIMAIALRYFTEFRKPVFQQTQRFMFVIAPFHFILCVYVVRIAFLCNFRELCLYLCFTLVVFFSIRPSQIWVGTTVFRDKFCQIPRRHLPNSMAHRGKFLEFRGSPRPPTLESLYSICATVSQYQ